MGSDAEEVEVVRLGDFVRPARRHAAEVISIRADDLDFGVTDVLVDRIEALLRAAFPLLVVVSDVVFPPMLSIKAGAQWIRLLKLR